MNEFIIEALQHYGYPALWLIIFLAAVGAPISGNLLLYAAGAFAAFGDFNVFILFPVSVSAAVLGDNLGYYIGRRVGLPLLAWFERQKRFRFISPQRVEQGRAYLRRRTGWAVFLTRFLIVVLGGPINFLAGIDEYPYRSFLFWDISGQILGAIIPLGLGYAFAESWEEVAGILGAFSGLFLALLVALIVAIVFVRKIHQSRKARAEAASAAKESVLPVSEATPLNGALPVSEVTSLNGSLPTSDGFPLNGALPTVDEAVGHNTGPSTIPSLGEPL